MQNTEVSRWTSHTDHGITSNT